MALYDDEKFFESYSHMPRSEQGLSAAGEWWQLEAMLPRDLTGMSVHRRVLRWWRTVR